MIKANSMPLHETYQYMRSNGAAASIYLQAREALGARLQVSLLQEIGRGFQQLIRIQHYCGGGVAAISSSFEISLFPGMPVSVTYCRGQIAI